MLFTVMMKMMHQLQDTLIEQSLYNNSMTLLTDQFIEINIVNYNYKLFNGSLTLFR